MSVGLYMQMTKVNCENVHIQTQLTFTWSNFRLKLQNSPKLCHSHIGLHNYFQNNTKESVDIKGFIAQIKVKTCYTYRACLKYVSHKTTD